MGEIIGAGLVAHAPTIMMSEADRFALNEGKEIEFSVMEVQQEGFELPKKRLSRSRFFLGF